MIRRRSENADQNCPAERVQFSNCYWAFIISVWWHKRFLQTEITRQHLVFGRIFGFKTIRGRDTCEGLCWNSIKSQSVYKRLFYSWLLKILV